MPPNYLLMLFVKEWVYSYSVFTHTFNVANCSTRTHLIPSLISTMSQDKAYNVIVLMLILSLIPWDYGALFESSRSNHPVAALVKRAN
jgi:hypothetical protein